MENIIEKETEDESPVDHLHRSNIFDNIENERSSESSSKENENQQTPSAQTEQDVEEFQNISEPCFIKEEITDEDYESYEDFNAAYDNTDSVDTDQVPKKVSSEGNLNCPVCNYRAACKCNYQRHIFTHTDPINRTRFKCLFCEHRGRTPLNLREHMFTHVDESEKFKCFICNAFCKSKKDFNDHIWLHKNLERQNAFECMYCHYEAYNVTTMKMHMLTHKNFIALQQCCLCQYQSKSKGDLLRHSASHKASPTLDTFKCGFCDYKTKYLRSFRVHLSTHGDKVNLAKLNTSWDNSNACVCQYRCDLCDFKTNHENEFEWHLMDMHKDYYYYNTEEGHLQTKQNQKDRFQCEMCPFITTKLSSLKCHSQVHSDRSERQVFGCTQCGKGFTTAAALKVHSMLHANPEDLEILHCQICSYKTIYKSSFKKHMILKHYDGTELMSVWTAYKANEKVYQCNECSYRAKTHASLKRHEDTHKDRCERELFQCAVCNATYTKKINLRDHILQQHTHPEFQPKYHCGICDFTTNSKDKLRKHKTRHAKGLIKKPSEEDQQKKQSSYQCEECSFTTVIYKSFKRHKETHKDRSERQLFTCARCNKAFTTKGHLNVHLLLHMDPEDRPTFSCELCSFKSMYKSKYKKHIKLRHSEGTVKAEPALSEGDSQNAAENEESKQNASKLRKFKCPQCPYSTDSSSSINRHLDVHKDRSERELFNCTICDRTFMSKRILKRHALVHMDPEERPTFRCQLCKFKSFYEMMLKTHYKTKHPEVPETEYEIPKVKIKREKVTYNCKECSYQTHKTLNLKRHEETHKERSERELYQCNLCTSSYTLRYSLKEHMMQQHTDPENLPKFQCERCEFTTVNKGKLRTHIQKHVADDKKKEEVSTEPDPVSEAWKAAKFKCNECRFHADQLSVFKRHQETHKDRSERKLFNCTSCDKTFTTRRHLKVHTLLHLGPEDRPTLRCEHCRFKTMYKATFRDHMKSKHPEVEFDAGEARAKGMMRQCKECSYQTKYSAHLKRHEETHKDRSERQLHQCSICNSVYTTPHALKAHMSQQHSETNKSSLAYQCYDCEFATNEDSEMKSHRMEHIKELCTILENRHNNKVQEEQAKEDPEQVWIKKESDTTLDESGDLSS